MSTSTGAPFPLAAAIGAGGALAAVVAVASVVLLLRRGKHARDVGSETAFDEFGTRRSAAGLEPRASSFGWLRSAPAPRQCSALADDDDDALPSDRGERQRRRSRSQSGVGAGTGAAASSACTAAARGQASSRAGESSPPLAARGVRAVAVSASAIDLDGGDVESSACAPWAPQDRQEEASTRRTRQGRITWAPSDAGRRKAPPHVAECGALNLLPLDSTEAAGPPNAAPATRYSTDDSSDGGPPIARSASPSLVAARLSAAARAFDFDDAADGLARRGVSHAGCADRGRAEAARRSAANNVSAQALPPNRRGTAHALGGGAAGAQLLGDSEPSESGAAEGHSDGTLATSTPQGRAAVRPRALTFSMSWLRTSKDGRS